jgi:hypothetical protein
MASASSSSSIMHDMQNVTLRYAYTISMQGKLVCIQTEPEDCAHTQQQQQQQQGQLCFGQPGLPVRTASAVKRKEKKSAERRCTHPDHR